MSRLLWFSLLALGCKGASQTGATPSAGGEESAGAEATDEAATDEGSSAAEAGSPSTATADARSAMSTRGVGDSACPALSGGRAVGTAGERKLALVVGVGDYLYEPRGRSIDLLGPPNDAKRIAELLVKNHGFPAENVCVLLDAQATTDKFEAAWQAALVNRASAGDTAVFFFAGHGSQVSDWDEPGVDETDGLDETLMLHDSRSQGGTSPPDLVDDRLNGLLATLYEKTTNVTALIDACNSGSATRAVNESVMARQAIKLELDKPADYDPSARVFGDYTPGKMPGLVFVSAARDGTSALERNGEGVFTNALLASLAEAGGPVTWNQLDRAIPRHISVQNSFQVATFDGQLDRLAFDSKVLARPLSWDVAAVDGSALIVRGPAMPGWSDGAVVAIYPGDTTAEALEKGAVQPKARAVLSEATPVEAKARVSGPASGITDSDLVVLESAGSDSVAIRVQIAAGVTSADAIEAAIQEHTAFKDTVQVVDSEPDFLVDQGQDGRLQVWGSEGGMRNSVGGSAEEQVNKLVFNLGLHARQRALLSMRAQPGGDYENDSTLAVRIVPAAKQDGCPKRELVPARAGALQEVPLCVRTQIEVELTQQPLQPLHIGVLYLSNDGSIYPWPRANQTELLSTKGEVYIEPLGRASPPLESPDNIVVFGSHESVDWYLLAAESTRNVGSRGLEGQVWSHIGGTRGLDLDDEDDEASGPSPWTSSFLQLRNVADAAQWTAEERQDPGVCKQRKEAFEASGSCP